MLSGLAVSYFLMNLAHVVLPSITVLYMRYRYGWDTRAVGAVLAAVGVCSLIVQGFLVKPAVKRFKERRAMAVGLAFGAIGFAIYGLAPTGPTFWIGVPVMALWGIATPSLQTIMTQLVGATEQGRLQGALASIVGLASLIGPIVFTQIFAVFIGGRANLSLPGAPFLLAAVLMVAAMLLAWRSTQPSAVAAEPA
jgi:DHA1 family tetracycline resistance protein-like MFS transporter